MIISSLEKMLELVQHRSLRGPFCPREWISVLNRALEVNFVILEKRDRFPFTIERGTLCM